MKRPGKTTTAHAETVRDKGHPVGFRRGWRLNLGREQIRKTHRRKAVGVVGDSDLRERPFFTGDPRQSSGGEVWAERS